MIKERAMRNLFLILLPAIFLLGSCGSDGPQIPPPNVKVFNVKSSKIPVYNEFVGEIMGIKDIAIRARVEGYLEGIHFREGTTVEKGDLLYSIESQPYEAEVAAMRSKVAEAKTMLAKAESDLNRIRPLAAENAVSQSDLDGAVAQFEAAEATLDASYASLRAANIQLSYTRIKSPITGIIGKTKAKVGDFVGRSPNPVILNVVSKTDTILVDFYITESQWLTLAREYIDLKELSERTRKPKKGTLELILTDGTLYDHKGQVDFIDRGVDQNTGAILVQSSFPNPDGLIRSGQFARIRAMFGSLDMGIAIPQRCVMELQGRYRVYVVNGENKVELREVKAGFNYYNFWIINEGLQEGDKVIYEGLQKVRPGLVVNPEDVQVEPVKTVG